MKLALSARAQLYHDFDSGAAPCCSIRGKLDKFLEERTLGLTEDHCNEKTAALYRRRLEMFDRVFHSRPINAIQKEEITKWIGRRLKRPRRGKSVSRDTVNNEIGALKTFARWAQGEGFAPASLPLLLVPRLTVPGKVPGKNMKPPEVMEIHLLMDIIDAVKTVRRDIGLFFYGMLYFNLRPSEAADLKVRDLVLPRDGRPGSLKCRREKTHQKQKFDIENGSFAHAWAEKCLELSTRLRGKPAVGSPLIICIPGRSRRNPGGWTTDTLDKATARACGKLGIELSRPYIIRHSVISWLNDHPDVSAAAVTVHASHLKTTTTDIYRHLNPAQAKSAFTALEQLMKTRDAETRGG